jgi:hypothetical protein
MTVGRAASSAYTWIWPGDNSSDQSPSHRPSFLALAVVFSTWVIYHLVVEIRTFQVCACLNRDPSGFSYLTRSQGRPGNFPEQQLQPPPRAI